MVSLCKMNLKLSLVLAVSVFAAYGECTFNSGFINGNQFPSIYDCMDNVDRTGLERASLIVNKEGKWFRRVDEFVQLPRSGGVFPGKIVCIEIADLSLRGVGGYVTRVSGGVGETSASLHLTSQLGRGLKFQITAYFKVVEATTTTKKK